MEIELGGRRIWGITSSPEHILHRGCLCDNVLKVICCPERGKAVTEEHQKDNVKSAALD